MKPTTLLLALLGSTLGVQVSLADSTIHTGSQHGYGANIGWTDWKWDTVAPEGATLEPYLMRGKIYAANVGWIDLGDGAPDDGVQYSLASGDLGVNHDGTGVLTGYAYGANIGWVTFGSSPTAPSLVDVSTGLLSGHAYSANAGWISLDGIKTCVDEGTDFDADTIADAWEYEQLAADGQPADLTILTLGGDSDGDGVSDEDEYAADTDPFDATDYMTITSMVPDGGAGTVDLTWATWSSRRAYSVNSSTDLVTWTPEITDLFAASYTVTPGSPLPLKMFFQVESAVHLCP
jgi:hypothetical protein